MIHTLDAAQAHERMARCEPAVVDVRKPGEWLEGHLPGARSVTAGLPVARS